MGRVISEVVNAEWIDIVDDKNKVIARDTPAHESREFVSLCSLYYCA